MSNGRRRRGGQRGRGQAQGIRESGDPGRSGDGSVMGSVLEVRESDMLSRDV